MTRLHGVLRSRASRAHWLANELGIALEVVPVVQANRLADPAAPDAPMNTLSPAFLALSPAGGIPVLEDDGLVLSESLAITLYLAKKHGGPLAPADAAEDAKMMQWALYGASTVEPPIMPIVYAAMAGRTEGEDIDRAVAALQRPLRVLDAHLAAHGHMVGGRFTVADLNMAEILRYGQSHPTLIPAFPAVHGWLKACQARPAFVRMWDMRNAEQA